MVVTGLNTRSRYRTPCSSRASWIRASVRTSANGRPSLREAGAELIQAHPGLGFGDSGRDDRDEFRRVDSLSAHTLYYDDVSLNVYFAI